MPITIIIDINIMSALKRMTNVEANSSLGQAFAIKITAWKIWHINYVYTEWSNDDAHFYKKNVLGF